MFSQRNNPYCELLQNCITILHFLFTFWCIFKKIFLISLLEVNYICMKKILGLDLGVTSVGWAFIQEGEENEVSKIINTGVRIVPLTSEEETDFKKGNTISVNANRTLKRGARRNLQRFKIRRKAILDIFKEIDFISNDFTYAESGKKTTFLTHEIRAKAATQKVTKDEFVKVLFMLNKKRGYKSSRKAKTIEEGKSIDGMEIAKELFNSDLTPGQWTFNFLNDGGKFIPDFYRSDLQKEFEKIVKFQNKYYPEINNELIEELKGKTKNLTSQFFSKKLNIELAENKGKRDDIKLQLYRWRKEALETKLDIQILAYVLTEINNQINQSSGYLGAISDRSKELYFNKQTVGQYLYNQLKNNANSSLKNQVFYRQDYMDEFEVIWENQAKFHPELNDNLKSKIRDITIFYQRKLKSQKHLISSCEFEKGHKVIPKSSPLFQEFRIWNNINNINIKNEITKEIFILSEELKLQIADILNFKSSISDSELIEYCGLKKNTYSVNFKKIEGNRTNNAMFEAFQNILILEGYDELDISKLEAKDISTIFKNAFIDLNLSSDLLEFDATIQKDKFDKQAYYQLWHLLYSSEDDETLKKVLINKFGFKPQHISSLFNIDLEADYGSLSAKAIKKLLPHLKDGHTYDKACLLVGYNHSSSLTKEANEKRELKNKLEWLWSN